MIAWKSKRLFKHRLEPLYNDFLLNTKRFGNKIGIQFNKTTLVVYKIINSPKMLMSALFVIHIIGR